MKRLSLLAVMLISGVALLSGCAGGNPNIGDAEDALEGQNYEQALTSVEQAITEEPQNAEAYLLKGRILTQQAASVEEPEQHVALIEEGMEAYDQAIEINPELRSDVQGRLQLAYINEVQQGAAAFNETQDYERAAAYFGAASALQPDSASAYLNEAYALVNAGRTTDAIEPLEETVARIEQPDSSDAQTYLLLAQLYQQEDRSQDAITVLEEVRDDFPNNSDLQAQLLNAYAQAGETGRAMEFYAEAVQNEPDNETYRYNYGSMLLNEDRFDEAIEQLEAAVELDPSYANAQYNLGAAYVNKAATVAEEIQAIDSTLSAAGGEVSAQERQQQEQRAQELNQQVNELFEQGIPPLERAREGTNDSAREQSICEILFRAYVRTGQDQQAQAAAECAGIEE